MTYSAKIAGDVRNVRCNDPDNGIFTGKVEAIHLPDRLLNLERWGQPCTFVERKEDVIRLAGKNWTITGSKYGVGNWCWNGYRMTLDTAVRFLVWLHGRHLFYCDSGEERLFDAWKSREPMDAAWVRQILIEDMNNMLGAGEDA
jgi:hypothetical protein